MTSLYIHIPFCQKKCLYCSFVVYVSRQKWMDAYLDALAKEAKIVGGVRLETVYVGGGTPSFLAAGQLQRLRQIIDGNFDVSAVREFTIEANPEDIDADKARLLLELGFDRVSLGVQTFSERDLKMLGRGHSPQKAEEAFRHLRQAGFKNINLDLMFAFPGQTSEDLKKDLKSAIKLESEHLSIYGLTVEPHSRFFAAQIQPQANEQQSEFYEAIIQGLDAVGLQQYEVSNFARRGKESLHNLNYWQGGNYIGLGVAAHSHQDGRRSWNVSGLEEYLDYLEQGRSPEAGFEKLTPSERLSEALVFGLRMNHGVELETLEKQLAVPFFPAQLEQIQELISNGFLQQQGPRLQTTFKGRLVLDELAARLI